MYIHTVASYLAYTCDCIDINLQLTVNWNSSLGNKYPIPEQQKDTCQMSAMPPAPGLVQNVALDDCNINTITIDLAFSWKPPLDSTELSYGSLTGYQACVSLEPQQTDDRAHPSCVDIPVRKQVFL